MSVNASPKSGDEPLGCPVCGNRAAVEDSHSPVAGAVCPSCEREGRRVAERARPVASSPCGMDDFWREMGWSDDAEASTPSCNVNEPTAKHEPE